VDVVCEEAPERGRPRRAPGARAPVVGLRQTLTGLEGRRERIRMEILMAAGVEAPHDAVTLTGTPDLHLWIQGGVPGDESTVSCLINAIGKAISASRPGLLTLLDLPPVAPLRPESALPS
ncbi:MAG TPA: hypothetical protein VFP98_00415, partial [Candidatus Polarisedimenticolia bacterium]|nr:hypothetical protein [Candidatus Polarisedimenticolia bacterium]